MQPAPLFAVAILPERRSEDCMRSRYCIIVFGGGYGPCGWRGKDHGNATFDHFRGLESFVQGRRVRHSSMYFWVCLSLSQGNLVNIEDLYYREHRYKSYATVPWGVARCCTSTSLKACLLGLVAAVGHHWIRDVGNNPCLTLVRSSWGSVRGRCFVVDGFAEAWVGCRQADCGVDPVLGVDCWSAVLAFNRCVDNGHFFHRGLVEGC